MAYIQRTIPQPNRVQQFQLADFSGGLNNRSTLTEPNEVSNVLNMTFYDSQTLEKRKGSVLHMEDTFDNEITWLDEYKPYVGEDQLVRASKTKIQIGNVSLGVSNPVDGENILGYYFFCDGVNLKAYGTFPQATSTFVRVIGTPVNDFKTMRVISTPTSYTPLDTSFTSGVTVYDYTNERIWYEPCQNEKEDPYKGVSAVPEKPSLITYFKGRAFVSGSDKDDDNVFISDAGNPFYFPPALPIQLPPNSDSINTMIVYDDSVIVGRKWDIYAITGETNNPELGAELHQLRKLNSHTGMMSNRCANVVHNYLFFLGSDKNAYMIASSKLAERQLSTNILTKKVNFSAEPYLIGDDDYPVSCTHFHDNVWYVAIKDYVFCYHYLQQAWTAWNNLGVRSWYSQGNTLLWGNDKKQVCKFGVNYLDNGVLYDAHFDTGLLSLGEPGLDKHLRDLYIVGHTFRGFTSNVTLDFELDFNIVSGGIKIENQVAVWGVSLFGDKFGKDGMNKSLPFTIGRRARTIKVKIKSDKLNEPMRVYQINGQYELRGVR